MEAPEVFDVRQTLLAQPRPLPDFVLRRLDAETPLTKAQLNGRWTLLYTGYSHCPDVCPATLGKLQKWLNDHPHIGAWFVTMDPTRDDRRRLVGYTRAFGSHVMPVSGETDELRKLTESLGFIDPTENADSDIAHSSAIALIGPDAALHGLFRLPHDDVAVQHVLQRLAESEMSIDCWRPQE